jgi:acyl-CoA synthetase (NDP forming)
VPLSDHQPKHHPAPRALMAAMPQLLAPKAIAVIGASQRGGRGTNVIANLRDCGFAGEIFAVNPRYQEILGYPCAASVGELPATVESIVVAVAADAACDVLGSAFAHGIRAAVVLAAGFGEGGHGEARGARLRSLAERGMCICGPNCFGLLGVKSGTAAYSGPLMRPLRPGPVALVSQSGGLGANVFAPLMTDRELGFSYFVSCGNQLGATIEDYIEYFLDDPDITVAGGARARRARAPQVDGFLPGRPLGSRAPAHSIAYRCAGGQRRHSRRISASLRHRAGRNPR